jgi:hypothetical protein
MIETPAQILSHHADAEAADAFIAWRKKIKKPLTERAAVMIAKSLSAINADGGDATEALDLAQEHGWQTIKPDWYWRQKNGNGHRQAGHPDTDATARQIAFAARAGRSPSEDCF